MILAVVSIDTQGKDNALCRYNMQSNKALLQLLGLLAKTKWNCHWVHLVTLDSPLVTVGTPLATIG
jgi:hypothetical protein